LAIRVPKDIAHIERHEPRLIALVDDADGVGVEVERLDLFGCCHKIISK
jgi:hypothetical protein